LTPRPPAAEQAEAEKFISFVLSPAGQQVMQSGDPTGDSLYYPVLNGISPLPALPSLAATKTQTINPPETPRGGEGNTASCCYLLVAGTWVLLAVMCGIGSGAGRFLLFASGRFLLLSREKH
jgi:hypothetical protein